MLFLMSPMAMPWYAPVRPLIRSAREVHVRLPATKHGEAVCAVVVAGCAVAAAVAAAVVAGWAVGAAVGAAVVVAAVMAVVPAPISCVAAGVHEPPQTPWL